MTATTSKLGADMTDEQREAIESGIAAMEKCGWTHRVPVLRALLASQPAAIDKQDERGDAPLSLIPELVKQDQCAVGDALLDMGDAMVAWRTEVGKYREITSLAQSAFSDGYEAGIAAILRARAASTSASVASNTAALDQGYVTALIKRMQDYCDSLAPPMARGLMAEAVRALRAASTSSGRCFFCGEPMDGEHEQDCPQADNVAQGAEAVGWFVRRSKFGPWVEVEQQEPGAEQFYRGAPPAQTALTDDVLMQAIADTAARGHVWASRALSNFRAAVREAAKSPDDA